MEATDRVATALREKLDGSQPTCYTCKWRKKLNRSTIGGAWTRIVRYTVVHCMREPNTVEKEDDDFCIYHKPMIDTDKTKWKPKRGD